MEETDLVSSLIPAVEQQLESADTPFVKAAYQRLIALDDISEDDAQHMIALCLADESNRMFIDKRNFDLNRYKELLEGLPDTLPQ